MAIPFTYIEQTFPVDDDVSAVVAEEWLHALTLRGNGRGRSSGSSSGGGLDGAAEGEGITALGMRVAEPKELEGSVPETVTHEAFSRALKEGDAATWGVRGQGRRQGERCKRTGNGGVSGSGGSCRC